MLLSTEQQHTSCHFPLPTYHKQQQLLPYSDSEGTRRLIVLSGGKPFDSRCYNGQGLVVN